MSNLIELLIRLAFGRPISRRRWRRLLIGRAAQRRRRRARLGPRGYVYVMQPEILPGWVKVGLTRRDVASRARELTTGLPGRLIVRSKKMVDDAAAVERAVHRALSTKRDPTGGEWFQITPEEATRCVDEHAQAHEIIAPINPLWAWALLAAIIAGLIGFGGAGY